MRLESSLSLCKVIGGSRWDKNCRHHSYEEVLQLLWCAAAVKCDLLSNARVVIVTKRVYLGKSDDDRGEAANVNGATQLVGIKFHRLIKDRGPDVARIVFVNAQDVHLPTGDERRGLCLFPARLCGTTLRTLSRGQCGATQQQGGGCQDLHSPNGSTL